MVNAICTYQFECDEQLTITEHDGGERNRKAEAEQKHDIGFVVVFVVSRIPVRSTRALQTFRDVPVKQISVRLMG